MRTSIFYLLIILIFLFACNTKPKEFLIKLILIFLACNTKPKEVAKGLPLIIFKLSDDVNKPDSSGNEGLVIRFYENGAYSHFGYNFFAFGNWKWDDRKNIITLNPTTSKDNNFTQQYKIEKKLDDSYSIRKLIVRDGKALVQRLENKTIALNTVTSNAPFTREMNTWRIKPMKSESATEIKLRTLNYLNFLLSYYEFVQDNKIDFLTYNWYATPIQMHYGNGVRMAYNNELADWYSCFYSVEEGNEAYKLISAGVQKSKIKSSESRAERNLEFIKELISAIN